MPNFLAGLSNPTTQSAVGAATQGLGLGFNAGSALAAGQALANTANAGVSSQSLTNLGFNAAVSLTSGASLGTVASTALSSLTGISFGGTLGGLLGGGGLSGTKPKGLNTEFAVGPATGQPFYVDQDIVFSLVRADQGAPSTPVKAADAQAAAAPIGTLGTLSRVATVAGAITGNATVQNVATGLAVAKAVTGLFNKPSAALGALGGGGGLADIPASSIQSKDLAADIPKEWQFITAPQDVSWDKASKNGTVDTFGTNSPYVTYGATSLRKMNLGNAMIEGFSDGKQVEGNINNLEVCMNMVLQSGYSAPYCWKVFAGNKQYGTFIITGVRVKEAMRDMGGKSTRAYVDVELQEVPSYQVSGGIDLAGGAIMATTSASAPATQASSQDAKVAAA